MRLGFLRNTTASLIPSGNLRRNHGTWHFLRVFPLKMVDLSIVVSAYQRVGPQIWNIDTIFMAERSHPGVDPFSGTRVVQVGIFVWLVQKNKMKYESAFIVSQFHYIPIFLECLVSWLFFVKPATF